jgi:hypothetical protein
MSAAQSTQTSMTSSASMRAWVDAVPSSAASVAAVNEVSAASLPSAGGQSQNALDQAGGDPTLSLLQLIVEMMVGHNIKLASVADLQPGTAVSYTPPNNVSASSPSAGFGIEYQSQTTQTQTEQSDFQAQGVVQTSDGKTIAVQLDLAMRNQSSTQTDVSATAGDAVRKDPLVINFGSGAAQLQDQHVSFDIAGDGNAVSVPLLAAGSGYIALDKNGNGKIDSGNELFGAKSGNGFADLAKYDSDGNGWIDQSDPIFNQLQVWTPDAQGGGKLSSLQQLGVGALYVGQTATPFTLKGSGNANLGDVRATGLYLTDSGQAGTLQQIDLMA